MNYSIEHRTIPVQKTARYSVLRPEGEPVAVMYVLHGYRQLSTYFITPFEVLAQRGVLVVAPEGLHRFYVEGYNGRVGASWMTSEEREYDIRDYLAYLEHLHETLAPGLGSLPIHLLGFSQGGATASRWLAYSNIAFRSLTLYASVFPNDFDFPGMAQRVAAMKVLLCFGDRDRFADASTVSQKTEWLQAQGYAPEVLHFEGLHKVYPEVLERVWRKIFAA